jgi:hypothetical protein
MLSASAQEGFRATQDNPITANRAEVHLHNYGEFDKACVAKLMAVVIAAARLLLFMPFEFSISVGARQGKRNSP